MLPHWQARHTLALGGAELRMEPFFNSRNVVGLKFPAVKKQDWEDTRMRKESVPSLPAEEAVGLGGGIREGVFSSLTIGYPALRKAVFGLGCLPFSPPPRFPPPKKLCFHLAHGSAPSNSSISQTKSYFLIPSLSHIITLPDWLLFPGLLVLHSG